MSILEVVVTAAEPLKAANLSKNIDRDHHARAKYTQNTNPPEKRS
ncbi:MAG: hypothetical protein ACFFBD_10325 [Candidatus Hodarchaeota archaeon]